MENPLRKLAPFIVVLTLVAAACGSTTESTTDAGSTSSTTVATTTTAAPATTAAPTTQAPTTTTAAPARAVDWQIHDAPGCMCADGSDYKFMTKAGDPNKVMVFLQAGGACFTAETCEVGGAAQSYSPNISADIEFAEAGNNGFGLFDFENTENPIADWSIIYLPYCTGDVFLGTRTNEYTPDIVINHTGAINAQKGVDYLFETFPDASQIFVTGSSAGGVPTPIIGGLVAEHYPDADVLAMGDGAGGYGSNPAIMGFLNTQWGIADGIPEWPSTQGIDVTTLGAPDNYIISGNQFDNLRLARFDHAYDATQTGFAALFSLSGGGTVLDVLTESETYIEAAGIDLPTYIAAGNNHTIDLQEEFYDLNVDGARFVDWLTAFINNEPIEDIHCAECGEPPAA